MNKLKPCPFCGGNELDFRDNTYWTGMRSALISVDLTHRCVSMVGMPRQSVSITAKTKQECIEIWNIRHQPTCDSCRWWEDKHLIFQKSFCKHKIADETFADIGFCGPKFGCIHWEGLA